MTPEMLIGFAGSIAIIGILCWWSYKAGFSNGRRGGWHDAAGFAAGLAETATLPSGEQHPNSIVAAIFRRGAERAAATIRETIVLD